MNELARLHPDFGRISSPRALRRYRTKAVLKEVAAERSRQEARWGEQNHEDGTSADWVQLAYQAKARNDDHNEDGAITWADILEEEFLEAAAELSTVALRAELVQVAAVAVAWIECIDRRERADG